jgi:hypothetical protein
MKLAMTCLAGAMALALAGCGEKPQAVVAAKSGSPSHAGTGTGYQAPGWKAGDASSWNEQLRTRAQYGQNEYSRTGQK